MKIRPFLWLLYILGLAICSTVQAAEDLPKTHVYLRYGVVPHERTEPGKADSAKPLYLGKSDLIVYRVKEANDTEMVVMPVLGGPGGFVNIKDVLGTEQIGITYYSDLIRAKPDFAPYYIHRASFFSQLEKDELARLDLNKAIALDPNNESAFNVRGVTWVSSNQEALALADFNEAIKLNPDYALAYYNRGLAKMGTKLKRLEAIADFTTASDLAPHWDFPWYARSVVHTELGWIDRALADLSEAIRCEPENPLSRKARAWIYATNADPQFRDGKAAVEDALHACKITKEKDAEALETLAAAYAESAQFAKAIETQEKANKLQTDKALIDSGRQRKALYEANKPFHEVPKNKTP